MATYSELVQVFGKDGVVVLERADVDGNGIPADAAEVLCSVGLPVTADILFTMQVPGEYEALTIVRADTPDGAELLLVLGAAPTDEHIRFCLDLRRGHVVMVGLEDGRPADAEIVNRTLGDFVEFLYRIVLRRHELAGSSAEEARPHTEELVARLKARDEAAFGPDRLWSDVFQVLLETGVPELGQGSREAIGDALEALLPGCRPLRWATGTPVGQGVQELSAYPADGHWLLVTHGFSDLDGELNLLPDLSGLGFELTMRVPRRPDDELPPGWAVQALRKLGEYVFGDDRPLADGHRMDIINPLDGADSRLTALAFVTDPLLGTIDTPGGRLEFLTTVGITAEELAEAKAAGTHDVVARIGDGHAAPLTDVTR